MFLALVSAIRPVVAQTNWIDPFGGGYFLTSNWLPADVPNTPGESAVFDLSTTYNVSFFAGDNVTINDLSVLDGDVSFVAPGAATYNTNDVVVAGGDLTLFESAAAGHVDLNADAISVSEGSEFTVDQGSVTTVNDTLTIGDFLTTTHGTVVVQGDSTLNANSVDLDAVVVGMNGSTGAGVSTLKVDGSGTTFDTSFGVNVVVGRNGPGRLEILNGAAVSLPANILFLTQNLSANGSSLLIDGGSTLSTYDSIGEIFGITLIGDGSFGDADVQVRGGSVFEAGPTTVDGRSSVTVDGAGSILDVLQFDIVDSSDVIVQNQGKLLMTGGGGDDFNGGSTLTVTGANSRIEAATGVIVAGSNSSNLTRIDVLSGGVIVPAAGFGGQGMELFLGDYSVLNVSGVGSMFDSGVLDISLNGSTLATAPQLIVDNGGVVMVDDLVASTGLVQLSNGTLDVGDDVLLAGSLSGSTVNSSGDASIDLLPGSLLNLGGNLVLGNDASLNLFGGELKLTDFANIYAGDADPINWNNGTVRINDDTTLTPTASATFLPSGTLGFGQELIIDDTLTLQSTLIVDGGTLSLLGLVNSQLMQLKSGRFEFYDDNLVIGVGGPLGEEFELLDGTTLFSDNDIIVEGILIASGGRTDSGLSTSATGEIRVQEGKRLDAATSLFNTGSLQLQGGRVDVGTSLTNGATGNILGRGTLAVGTVLTNQGDLALSNGQTDVFGDVNNTGGGRVIISGNADVTFWDDVTDSGALFNVSTGSTATFFGTAGFGITGGGDVYFEADVTPGSSPGEESFGGNVHLGALSSLEIEIAGLTPGTEFDLLTIAGAASLSGALDVSLLGGFTPTLGDTFEILSAVGGVSGVFSAESFPAPGPFLALQSFQDVNSVTLAVVPALAGDYNADGTVDAADYTVWRDTEGQTGIGLAADGNGDGTVNAADYTLWTSQFGQSIPPAIAVPEPSGLALLACVAMQLTSRRKRACD